MAAYRHNKSKVTIHYKDFYRRRKRRGHILFLLAAIGISCAAVLGTHMLLEPFQTAVPAAASAATPASKNSAVSSSTVDKSSWKLRLVNASHPLPENFTVETSPVGNVRFDIRAAGELQSLLDACSSSGNRLILCSGYRSISKQTTLYQTEIRKVQAQGSSNAAEEAATIVAKPGTSEHNLGLAVDFGCLTDQRCDEAFGDTPEGQWLMNNAYQYGFILRYPKGKESITGIIYEPWHYRYVGKEAAKEIHEKGICLEEYLA
ncbi:MULTISPECIES: M15 family metallopeptidase [Caproicibacterium]|uniref:M15 family metallopeptidase n=1 Tax=Caproicibacterium argilliputei TaxID=3030016 RepID=A0AA97DA38_9FIRM|nr:M15 family metallopeptidase [Caproicibacterium argilliputei]WOC32427.1 M15 family metallopeptidase [Caproicibacterium argilliputei]